MNFTMSETAGTLLNLKAQNAILKTENRGLIPNRVESIDILRGIVMIVMALDHIRHYFHFDSMVFDPSDLERTTLAFFGTRFITHLCAPTFILLAGTAVYFVRQRKTKKETSVFLITRGLWLVVLQMTIIRFGWNFDPGFHYNSSTIISTIGFCMIGLSILIHFPFKVILAIGLAMVVGHNTLDGIRFESGSALDVLWTFLHGRKLYVISEDYSFLFLYPIIPWVGVIALGYCLGRLYGRDYNAVERKRILLLVGVFTFGAFVALRLLNWYGDPVPWIQSESTSVTVMSFFNITKYPPSLIFLSCTLGIALVLLSVLDDVDHRRWRAVSVFGKVALFYYVLHIYVIHILGFIAVVLYGYPWQTMVFQGTFDQFSPLLVGKYGFSLGAVYGIWVAVVLMLYPFCRYWLEFKGRKKSKWWVSYV
jgi:uncharacterized membrane protein